MIEIFNNIPLSIKQVIETYIKMAFQQQNAQESIKMIEKFLKTCQTEEEKEFVRFCIGLELEKELNENSND